MKASRIKRVAVYSKNLGTYFGASLIPMVLNLAINPFVAQNMSPEDYSIAGYYTSFSTLIGPIIYFYFVQYYIKEFFRKSETERVKLVAIIAKLLVCFSSIIAAICFILLYIYLYYIKSSANLPIFPYLLMMVVALPLTGLYNLKLAEDRIQKKANAFFTLSVSNGVLSVILTLVFVVFLQLGAFGKLLAPLLTALMIFFYMINQYKDYLKIKIEFKEYIPVVKFCFPLALSAALGYFTNGYPTTYLESLNDITKYGIYVVGYSIGHYLMVFSTAVNNTFQPDLYESMVNKRWHHYFLIVLAQLLLIGVIVVAFISLAPSIIKILTAGRYTAATPYAQIIAISTFTSTFYFIINNLSIVTNHPNYYLYTTILGSIFIVVALPWFVSNWGFYGGAWLNVVSFIVFSLINILLLAIGRYIPSLK